MADEIKPSPPVNQPNSGKIVVVVSGQAKVGSTNPNVVVERK